MFGLIMVLTVTLGASLVAPPDANGAGDLLRAAIGCNLAWGIIDGVLYLLGAAFDRSQRARLGALLRGAPNLESATELLCTHIDEALGPLPHTPELRGFCEHLAASVIAAPPVRRRVWITRADLLGAASACFLVVASCIPAIIPFLFIQDRWVALRVSNLCLIVLLFWVGWYWGRFGHGSRIRSGLTLLVLGLALVGVAIALGG